MSTQYPLRILSLEDDPKDTELIHALLDAEGISCEIKRVDTEAEFAASLQRGAIDLILADYTLPSFDGLSALKLAITERPEVPFLFVSGTLGEEIAIEALKFGATDYVFKTKLSRLVPSVLRAIREAEGRVERRHVEKALRRSEMFSAEAQRLSRTGSFGRNLQSGEVFWSAETYRIFGCNPEITPTVDLVLQRTHPQDRERLDHAFQNASADGREFDIEHRLVMDDGFVRHVRVVARILRGDSPDDLQIVGAVTDITEAKLTEQARQRSERYLADAQSLTHHPEVGHMMWRPEEAFTGLEKTFDCSDSTPERGVPLTKIFSSAFIQRIGKITAGLLIMQLLIRSRVLISNTASFFPMVR